MNKNESVCQMVSQNIRYTIILSVPSASAEMQNSNAGYLQFSFNEELQLPLTVRSK